jgi:hypothetical protein
MPTQIQFFLPWQHDGLDDVPRRADQYWEWIVAHRNLGEGKYSWTLQTYLQLCQSGIPCVLTSTFPSEGIVISHRDFLPASSPPKANVYLVCIKPDRKEHTWAHHYLVQNEADPAYRVFGHSRVDFVLHWPQPSLRMRNPARGTLCRNVAYIGRRVNLAPEIQDADWKRELDSLGFAWSTPPMEAWHDYSEIDITVSVREFGDSAAMDNAVFDPASKPPTKLTNSWLAGVPAIVAEEPAYMSVRRSRLDFIAVRSKDELRSALITLQSDPALFQAMQANGLERAKEFSASSVAERWVDIVQSRIAPAHDNWLRRPALVRQTINIGRVARYLANWGNISDILKVVSTETRALQTR